MRPRSSRLFRVVAWGLAASLMAMTCSCVSHPKAHRAAGAQPTTAVPEFYPGAIWTPSPNFGAPIAPGPRRVRWLVLHTTEDSTAKVVARLTNPATRVSVHYLVTRDGRIVQFVRNGNVAYGVGNLAYNRASISIEFERYGDQRVTDRQLRTAKPLVQWLLARYGIAPRCWTAPQAVAPADPLQGSGILGHGNVPDPRHPDAGGGANHHTDPVNWDWQRFEAQVLR